MREPIMDFNSIYWTSDCGNRNRLPRSVFDKLKLGDLRESMYRTYKDRDSAVLDLFQAIERLQEDIKAAKRGDLF